MEDDDSLRIHRKIRYIGKGLNNEKNADMAELGLTPVQSETLIFLSNNAGSSIGDLGSYLGISHQAACALVDRMVGKGLLSSRTSDEDGRAKKLSLTEEGKNIRSIMRENGIRAGHKALDGISKRELASFERVLDRIIQNIDGSD